MSEPSAGSRTIDTPNERNERPCLPLDPPPAPPGGWGVAELHCHTTASDGVVTPEQLVEIADRLEIDVLAVTDHDTIEGALRARDHAVSIGARVEVIVGMEVTTRRQDHIVGLFLDRTVRIFRSVPDTVDEIHAQGGLAVVAHPFLGLPSSISPDRLRDALRRCRFDAIEAENPYMREGARGRLTAFIQDQGEGVGAKVGASDAHFGDLAKAVTLFEGRGAADLRGAVEKRATVPAIGRVRHPRPGLRAHLQNQYRSLLRLPVMRAGTVWRQWRDT
ncbi:MAG: PHP domain-containing protein [Chloroflexota bacterium]|nr:PHP domain-containing protein [Chloroflexota bacterium]MDE2897030.1 PHP domain-containing protein [Chloroflexota bacterium]